MKREQKRWLNSSKLLLIWQGTWVWFTPPMWLLITTQNSRYRESDALFACTGSYVYVDHIISRMHTQLHINVINNSFLSYGEIKMLQNKQNLENCFWHIYPMGIITRFLSLQWKSNSLCESTGEIPTTGCWVFIGISEKKKNRHTFYFLTPSWY